MIKLRQLDIKDAQSMLEWMHDPKIQMHFKKDMLGARLEDVEKFIISSSIPNTISTGDNIHLAIVDEYDEYLGTISLKDIDLGNRTAEYAIATRMKAHGKGVAFEATGLILKMAFNEIGLHRVYLNVFSNNIAAIRLYEKSGFKLEGEFRDHIKIREKYMNWKWYGILENEFNESMFNIGKINK